MEAKFTSHTSERLYHSPTSLSSEAERLRNATSDSLERRAINWTYTQNRNPSRAPESGERVLEPAQQRQNMHRWVMKTSKPCLAISGSGPLPVPVETSLLKRARRLARASAAFGGAALAPSTVPPSETPSPPKEGLAFFLCNSTYTHKGTHKNKELPIMFSRKRSPIIERP